MERYYVNRTAQSNGDHEVHSQGCYWLSLATYTIDLGLHANCQTAVMDAKRHFARSNGCASCAPLCHTS